MSLADPQNPASLNPHARIRLLILTSTFEAMSRRDASSETVPSSLTHDVGLDAFDAGLFCSPTLPACGFQLPGFRRNMGFFEMLARGRRGEEHVDGSRPQVAYGFRHSPR